MSEQYSDSSSVEVVSSGTPFSSASQKSFSDPAEQRVIVTKYAKDIHKGENINCREPFTVFVLSYFMERYGQTDVMLVDNVRLILTNKRDDSKWRDIETYDVFFDLSNNFSNAVESAEESGKKIVLAMLSMVLLIHTPGKGMVKATGHSNVLIYNLETGALARYDPSGINPFGATYGNAFDGRITKYFNKDYKDYIGPLDFCPRNVHKYVNMGAPEGFDKTAGICKIMSLHFIELYLKNPNKSLQDIQKEIEKAVDSPTRPFWSKMRRYMNRLIKLYETDTACLNTQKASTEKKSPKKPPQKKSPKKPPQKKSPKKPSQKKNQKKPSQKKSPKKPSQKKSPKKQSHKKNPRAVHID